MLSLELVVLLDLERELFLVKTDMVFVCFVVVVVVVLSLYFLLELGIWMKVFFR